MKTAALKIKILVIAGVAFFLSSLNARADERALPRGVQVWYRAETERLSRDVDITKIVTPKQNSQDPRYSPELHLTFEIEGFWVPANLLRVYDDGSQSHLTSRFQRVRNGVREILFLVHPESYDLYQSLHLERFEKESFNALSTASSRSLLVWKTGLETEPFIAKLSLNKEIGGVVRSIKGTETATSIGVSKILHSIGEGIDGALFMPEVFSAIPNGFDRGGQIIRELGPVLSEQNRFYIPLFSLYGGERSQEPYLMSWIRASGLAPREFVDQKIIRPFVKVWADMAIEQGVLTEPHAQNVLIEVESGQPTGRFVFRDYGGFNIDLNYRRMIGQAARSLPTFTGNVANDYYQAVHADNIITSLYTFFEGGFLYNIEAVLETELRLPSSQWTKRLLTDELSRYLSLRLNKKVVIGTDYSNLIDAVDDARVRHLARVAPTRTQRARDVVRAFDNRVRMMLAPSCSALFAAQ